MNLNFHAIRAIYKFEMARFWRTLLQSIVSPVISTSLYFVVFGAAIGSRITAIDGVNYGAFIVPGLIMLSLLTQSISNASFAIFFPKFTGTIYELLSAPVSYIEIVISYVGAAATKSIILVEEKADLMRKLGKKRLTLLLHDKLDEVPSELAGYPLELAADGSELIYTYETQIERSDITDLLADLNRTGIKLKDLQTKQSSLEDIFVSLVKERQ